MLQKILPFDRSAPSPLLAVPQELALIEHLKRLEELRQKMKEASMLKKMELAEKIGEESFKFAHAAAIRIIKLEQEIQQWKQQSSK